MSPVGEAESHLREVVLEIAFALMALLKSLLSLLRTYMKAGKFLLQAYYNFTLKYSPHKHLAALRGGFRMQFAATTLTFSEWGEQLETNSGSPQVAG